MSVATLQKALLSTVCLLATAVARPARAIRTSPLHPVLRVDLSPLGAHIGRPWLYRLLRFVDDRTLAVAFVARNPRPPALVRRGEPPGPGPFLLKVALISVAKGEIVHQVAWPTRSAHSGLLAAPGSDVVALVGNWVWLFNRRLQPVGKLELPRLSEAGWLARVSPSGRNALLIQDTGPDPGTWAWLDAASLHLERVWSMVKPSPPDVFISDDYIAFRNCEGGVPRLPCTLVVQGRRDGRIVFAKGTVYGEGFHFVSDSVLFTRLLPLPPVGFSVILLGVGRAKMRSEPSLNGFVAGSPAAAPQANRFVVPVLDDALQPEYLYLFDGRFPHWRALRIGRIKGFNWPWAVATSPRWLALSPDGTLLAVMPNFETVLIYKLPPPKHH